MSAADLMAVLLAQHLRYDFSAPGYPGNDHLIFSKGHAAPLLYAMYKAAGAIDDRELLSFRRLGSRLEGHPTPRLPWVDVATGSPGLGLPAGVGLALVGRRPDRLPYRVWVLCGDSELAEGSMWEAFEHAGHEHLDNLIAIIDVSRPGRRGETRHGWDTGARKRRIGAFDWHTIEVDGHDVAAVDRAYAGALAAAGQPIAIIARTVEGKGVAAVQHAEDAHGKPLRGPGEAIAELGGIRDIRVPVHPPEAATAPCGTPDGNGRDPDLPRYERGDSVPTRVACGEALAAVGGARHNVVVLDGEASNRTRTDLFARQYPDRFFHCPVAEQQLVAAALGMQARGFVPFVTTFAALFARAYDVVRMAAISRATLKLVGSDAGVSAGEDGPSRMSLEDLAMFRAVHGSVVLCPCDANQTTALVAEMAAAPGIGYLRASGGATPVIYGPDEKFPVGGSKVLRSSDADRVTIIAAGVTVPEALSAADALAADGIHTRVIDLYSVKPVDTRTLRAAAEATENFVTAEDHWPEGGVGDAVLAAFGDGPPPPRVTKLAAHTMPGSATQAEQLHVAGIDAKAIEAVVHALIDETRAVSA